MKTKELQTGSNQNLFALLQTMFAHYANQLRDQYPGRVINNASVFDSAVREDARRGLIVLVKDKASISSEVPAHLIRRLEKVKKWPLWVPTTKFPADPLDLASDLRPSLDGDTIVWKDGEKSGRRK